MGRAEEAKVLERRPSQPGIGIGEAVVPVIDEIMVMTEEAHEWMRH